MRNATYGLFAFMLLPITLSCSEANPSWMQAAPANGRTVFQRKAQVGLREAAAALTDSNHRGVQTSASTVLGLADIVQQTCTNQPGGAVITIESSETNSFVMDSLEKNYQKDVFINAAVERSYKIDGEELECARKQPIIEVDLDRELVKLQLDVKHRREEKTYISELQKPQPATTTTTEGTDSTASAAPPPPPSRQMSAITSLVEGTRKVTFTVRLGEVNDEVSYSKESQGQGTRKETVQSSGGQDQVLNFTLTSQFKMVDTYNEHAHDKAVGKGPLRKEITEGTVKSTLAGQGYVETQFTGLKLEFTQGACKATAGKIQSRFFAEGGTSPEKTVDYDVATGSVNVSILVKTDGEDPSKDQADILASTDIQKELCAQDAFTD